MSFQDIACHVWAIDGYADDDTAGVVNTRYASAATERSDNNVASKTKALARIIAAARVSEATADRCIIYGGFRRGQNAPEHMWLEYNGTIYETMPGYDLHQEPATPSSRKKTQLENDALQYVAAVDSVLTVAQRRWIV